MAEIRISIRASAPLETVWEVLYDHVGMAAWTPAASARLEREGNPPPNGVGAIRVLSRSGLHIREQVTAVEPPTRLTYRMLSGLPIRDYAGEATLTRVDDATDIAWVVTLTPRFPGVGFAVRKAIGALASGLAAESERRADAPPPDP